MPPPVVVTKNMVSLADHLDLRNLPLSTTPAGKNFVIKSLHPADHEIKSVRGPGSTVPTLGVCADMVDTIPFPAGATSAYLVQTPNPAIPLSVIFVDSAGVGVEYWLWSNPGFGGPGLQRNPTYNSAVSFWGNMHNQIEAYRVLAQSVTVDVIAPAVADQGTIVSAQFEKYPQTMQATTMIYDNNTWKIDQFCDVWAYDSVPEATAILMGTNAYTAKAREGFYQPLKIGTFKWRAVDDYMIQMAKANSMTAGSVNQTFTTNNFPIYFAGTYISANGLPIPKPTSKIIGLTWIEGTEGAPRVSLRLRARQVTEIIPTIGGTYAPLAEAPYPPDELAFKMVKEISARMKDAYPASYNASGKLKDIIKNIGEGILKFSDPVLDVVGMIPGVGNVASGVKTAIKGAKAVAGAVKAATERKKLNIVRPNQQPKQTAAPPAPSGGRGRRRRGRK